MSTSYPADFPADRAYEAVEPQVFLSVDPLIVGALLLAALAIAAFAWWLGRTQASRDPDAAESIWKAIDDAAKAAMKADNHAIPAKAQALRDTIDKKLGKTLKLAGGLKMKALDDALAGKGPAHPHSAGGGSANTVHGSVGDPTATAASASAGNVTIVSVSGGASATETAPPPPPPPPPPSGTRILSADERNDALRLAVAAINEHWRHKADRIAAMRAAHAELSGH